MSELSKSQKRQWAKALRSGEYKQSYGRLHDRNGFCCLGVYADLFIDGDWIWSVGCWRLWFRGRPYGGILPATEVPKKVMLTAIEMNDAGRSFDEIADWIDTL